MKDSFTLNDLILFAYDDDAEMHQSTLKKKMEDDEDLKNELQEIIGARYCLECDAVSPGQKIINNIMSYSRALNMFKTKSAGNIRLLMN